MKQVPPKTTKEIAAQLGSGFRVFLNKDTLELLTYPNEDESLSFEPSEWKTEIDTVRKKREKFLEVKGMAPHDSFRMMEAFIVTVSDPNLQERLSGALRQRKPFAHFKRLIDQSGPQRQRWFSFRDQRLIEWVEEQLVQLT